MRFSLSISKIIRTLLVIGLVGFISACARTPTNNVDGGTPGSQQEFLVTVGDRIFFDTGSSVVANLGQETLNKQAVWLNQYSNYNIIIEGHADERGTREYNIALSARRAAATVNYLISRGVSANRINSKAYGKERPVAVCNDISCWSQNRRAVTVIN
ncbi:MAG: OmpA family protein [Devosiaceae bacterium]|nr:OmpA family protein [Devosiaceae bacterium]